MKYSDEYILQYVTANGTLPPGMNGCGPSTTTQCCNNNVSRETEMLARAANRTVYYGGDGTDLDVADLAAGASKSEAILANGMWRCVHITDIVGSGLPTGVGLDSLRFDLQVGPNVRLSFLGGRYNRGNANDCTPACGISVCAGPSEQVSIKVTNITAQALDATAAIMVETRTAYSGEEGFCCSPGSCDDGVQKGGC